MIYGPVFAVGSVALTRVSKALHSDTKRALYRNGVCRVHIESNQDLVSPGHFSTHRKTHARETFPNEFLAKVENLQVRISFNHDAKTGLTASMLGSQLGTRCRAIHVQLAKSLVSCKNYFVVFPDGTMISRTGLLFESLRNNRMEFLNPLRSMAFEFYLEGRWRSSRYDREGVERIEAFMGFVESCFIGM